MSVRRSLFSVAALGCFVVGCSPSSQYQQVGTNVSLDANVSLGDGAKAPVAARTGGLRERIERVLEAGRENRILDANDNAAWQIMHGVICYGPELEIRTPDRGRVSALDYAFSNGQIRGFQLMLTQQPLRTTGRPGVLARFEPGSYVGQGHVDQWLAICAMADIPLETEVKIGEAQATLLDWARQVQYDVPNNPIDEYSWTLIALTHYFPDEPSWDADGSIRVSWEQLVEHELTYDLDSSACGGTHRMAGIIAAVRAKERLGLPDSPVWSKARNQIDSLLTNARQNRGPGGQLSSFYFTRPGNTTDLSAQLSSTGHMFEFVALAASPAELQEPWVEDSAAGLCELLEATSTQDLDCGALYHALSGLKVYLQRRYGDEAA